MAVNENLYNWMLKTQGMPAAEWYRNNPTKPHTSNPHVPPGAAKWFPSASVEDPQKQRTASALDPLRDPGTYAAASPEIEEISVVEPAASSSSDYFQQFLNSLDASQRADIEGMSDLSAEDKANVGYDYAARQKLNFGDPLTDGEYAAAGGLYYTPTYGEYGGYLSKTNPDKEQVAIVQKMIAQQKAGTADPSWANQNLSGIISQSGLGGWHVRGATPDDPEVQKYGIYNVGRSDYMQSRRDAELQKTIETLRQQTTENNQNSQQFLGDYIAEGAGSSDYTAETKKGPRGEDLGDVARNQGPSSPVKYDEQMKQFVPNPGAGRPTNVRPKFSTPLAEGDQTDDSRVARSAEKSDTQRERLAQQAEYDPQKAKAAAASSKAYKTGSATEDPFRRQAIFG